MKAPRRFSASSSPAIFSPASVSAFSIWAASCLLATACGTSDEPRDNASTPSCCASTSVQRQAQHPTKAPEAPGSTPAAELAQLSFLGGPSDASEVARIRSDSVRRFTPVGTTSVVFKVHLDDASMASFRARTRTHPHGWSAEIAAYRIARALRMDQVPVAVAHRISRNVLVARFDNEKRERLAAMDQNIVWDADGFAIGAAVPWVPQLRDLGFETNDGIRVWAPWLLVDSPMPDAEHVALARDMSIMLAFDLLIANFDRMSGGNLKANADGTRVVIRDHNLAFITPFPEMQRAATERRFVRVERFSRSFVLALRALDETRLRSLLHDAGSEPARDLGSASEPLLTEPQVNDVLSRRQSILTRIDALIARRGENSVLVFE